MNEKNILVITDREELYNKCENMEQLFDKYYLPLLDKHYSKTYKLQQENARLKDKNEKAFKIVDDKLRNLNLEYGVNNEFREEYDELWEILKEN